jgi:hypothetical protein
MQFSKILTLAEPIGAMTFAEGLAFIERTRRQLDRFDDALPHAPDLTLAPDDAAEIRRMCDELEADIEKYLSGI